MDRKLSAILAADVVGYSALMERDEAGTFERLRAGRKELFEPEIARHHGQIFKLMGDGMLAEFGSVVDAVECAVSLQRGLAERNVAVPEDQRIRVRIGINLGEVIVEGEDRYGEGVNVAARLEGLAEPGGICVSGRVQEDVQGKLDITFEDIGEQKLKNIARPVRTFRVRLDATAAPAPAGWRRGLYAALALMILLAVGALWTGLGSEWTFLTILRSGDQPIESAEVGTKPAIAILPFLNQSDDSAREYFADGLTQDIINALGRFSALTVMSWNAVLPYKVKPASPEEIGRGLAVSYLVEGSVRQTGDRVLVITQLVDTRQGRVLWSGRFEEALADVFALQDNIVTHIVRVLAIRVTQIEQNRVFTKPTENLAAYDYVLRARPALQRPTHANNVEARALLKRAIELDPNYAAAYAALAETYHLASSMGWAESPTAFLSRAEELATKALRLDDSDVRARITLGHIHLFHQRYNQAEAEIERAIAINPNDAHGLAGRGTILLWLGHTDEAIEALEQAQRIDPDLNAIDRFALSLAYYLERRYDAAIEQAELNLRTTAGANFSRILLAAAYAQDNRADDAARVVTMIRRIDPTFDPKEFGNKFLNSSDLEHLRDGFRKARLYPVTGDLPPAE
ncbi:putative adenylate class-3/4/guanylyl cyclase [Mesorhizobium prunaredense]|uniref:Putative adenylate class-3/4/guanylyl cyclase n=1 Tax=Mesorhizobium prunaredense TaxID=1631249 RepID=A0A1R3UYU7_9HYPH|nr:tetratricopeptide repeat protein [Mesorhizobium prunaredense]SIT52755.1 putative adenylate class-3/4/guanylyl cyclase [Mesorhizobium prunaredense]